jgi:predicted chitinase
MKITNEILSSIAGKTVNLSEAYIAGLNQTLEVFNISTPNRVAHFLAQCCHESGRFRWFAELASGDAYEHRKDIGNNQPGDGRKYKGAGAIQITGRYWYQRFSDFTGDKRIMEGVDYVSKRYPFDSSGFWWTANKMNERCDSGNSCAQISAVVNGKNPATGLAERERFFAAANNALRLSSQRKPKPGQTKYTLKAIRSTVLKKHLKQSSLLEPNQIVDINPGKAYQIESLSEVAGTGHYKVQISHGAGEWYVYAPHWSLKSHASLPEKIATKAVSVYKTQVRAANLSQPDSSTCQAACIGMATSNPDIHSIRKELDQIAIRKRSVAGGTAVMGEYLKERIGSRYEFDFDASLDEMKKWLQAGELLITHGWFTNSGHIICLDGVEIDNRTMSFRFDVKDPWSEFNAPAWAYNINKNFYDGYYSSLCIYAACVASASRSQAASIYNQKRIDPSLKGAWVHRIKPL